MAINNGIIKPSGTIDGVTFCNVGTKNIMKKKSSLTRKRVQTAAEYAKTGRYCAQDAE